MVGFVFGCGYSAITNFLVFKVEIPVKDSCWVQLSCEESNTKLLCHLVAGGMRRFSLRLRFCCYLLAVAILPSTAIYPQRLFCRELFVIGQS